MIKDPDSFYEDKRSNYMLKVKPEFDEEAEIVDYKLGKGKNLGILGSFICAPLKNMDTYHLHLKIPIMNFLFLEWMILLGMIMKQHIQLEPLLVLHTQGRLMEVSLGLQDM